MTISQFLYRFSSLFIIFFCTLSIIFAQQGSGGGSGRTAPPPPPLPSGAYQTEDDTKGSVVRGRVFYQNTGKPLRRGWIGLTKIRELVEPQNTDKNAPNVSVARSYGNEKYALTNDKGEFVLKGVKAGIYQPVAKVQGILNPGFNDPDNPNFQQITIDGISEVQANITVQRGGAISGRVLHADGEPVIGARMQILIKKNGRLMPFFGDRSGNNASVTDDRGFYRFTALPANEYVVYVTEPSVQNNAGNQQSGYGNPMNIDSELKTFYPNAGEMTDARTIDVAPEQEQTEINISVPDRVMFKISGTVVAKSSNLPLKNMRVSFRRISENGAAANFSGMSANQTMSDVQGNWSLIDLPAGKYLITASPNNSKNDYIYSNEPKPTEVQPKLAPLTKLIEISSENPADMLFQLPVQATISGTVTVENDKPLPDYIYIGAFDEQTKNNSSANLQNRNNQSQSKDQSPKTNNEFRIEGLSDGKYNLTAFAGGSSKYFVKSISLNGRDVKEQPVEIKEGEDVKGVQIVLSTDVGTVKGKISGYKNDGPVYVVLIPAGRSIATAMRSIGGQGVPKPGGEFEITSAPGEYFVFIGTNANRPKSESGLEEWFEKVVKPSPKVTVKPGETTNIDLNY